MIRLQEVSKWYHSGDRVLQNLSLSLDKGDFLYVVGGSGAGKSSLLRLLATEESASQGRVEIFGQNLGQANGETLREVRRSIGYIPQNVRLIPDLTVFENLEMSLKLASGVESAPERRKRIFELLTKIGLSEKAGTLACALSGGEAQRVAIARALIRGPKLLIADEPTGAQDRDYTWAIMDLFLKANLTGTTVILATHDREIVRRVRKRCAVLREGRIELEDGICTY